MNQIPSRFSRQDDLVPQERLASIQATVIGVGATAMMALRKKQKRIVAKVTSCPRHCESASPPPSNSSPPSITDFQGNQRPLAECLDASASFGLSRRNCVNRWRWKFDLCVMQDTVEQFTRKLLYTHGRARDTVYVDINLMALKADHKINRASSVLAQSPYAVPRSKTF